MKRILDRNSRRRFSVAAVIVIATLGFAVGSASAADKGHFKRVCPVLLSSTGLSDRPIWRHCRVWPHPTTSTTVKAPGTTSTTVPSPVTVKPPVTITVKPPTCPPLPILRETNSSAATPKIVCPLTTESNGTTSATAATPTAATEIGTACVIIRSAGATTSSGCTK